MQRPGQRESSGERHGDAEQSGEPRDAAQGPYFAQVEMQADQEHEQDESDLAEGVQRGQAFGREQSSEQSWRKQAEQRRAKQQSGNDLPNHRRLADALDNFVQQTADGQ